MQHRLFACFLALFILMWATNTLGQTCDPWVARLEEGQVEYSAPGESLWHAAQRGQTFCQGDHIHVGENSRATLYLINQTVLRLDADTHLTLTNIIPEKPSWLELLQGTIHFLSRVPHSLEAKTPFINANIEGTEFVLRVSMTQTDLWVYEGRVRFYNNLDSLAITQGQAAVAEQGKAPRRVLVVHPRDAVQWALYYPPLIDYQGQRLQGPAAGVLHQALRYYRQDHLPQALRVLEKLPQAQREHTYYTLHAGLLLSVGRMEEARRDLHEALRMKPDDGIAHALQAIIVLVNNDKEKALSLALQSKHEAPDSPVPYIALSYVEQARFKLDDALNYGQTAVALARDDALAQARLAELWLMQGELDQAVKVARQAVVLDPELGRTQSVLGFAHLTQMATDEANAAFTRAIALDAADPLPRLGLGLAKIRQGELKQGRQEIEIAASLDPNNSLIRSYLGKAYYEEKRNPLAMDQYEMAKELDPNDPTPYFYDAIRKQTTNKPVEALQNLQKAIQLNNNRTVFRSKQLLDEDLAARSASLGRIYNDLNFSQRALVEGWKSVNINPGNYSAHRFLADSYSKLRRHEIARVSELLQSQLLQPINVTPIQPQLSESNLLILDNAGPAKSSFNEFNPLFARNRLTLQASSIFGSNNTFGDEVVHSGLWNKFSYSLGQFHYGTDGFRKNNDLTQNIYTAFAQARLWPTTSIQTELRHNESESGDVILHYFPKDSLPNQRTNILRDSLRFGATIRPSTNKYFIASAIFSDVNFKSSNRIDDKRREFTFTEESSKKIDSTSYNIELQYQQQWQNTNLIIGGGHFDETRKDTDISSRRLILPSLPPITITPPNPCTRDTSATLTNAYIYSTIKPFNHISTTFGLSYDSYGDFTTDFNKLSPKFGLIWELTKDTIFRAAAFKSVKRPLVSNQTIEPTQAAGFNQFFDDINGSEIKRYGVGIDHSFSSNLFAGIEASWREIKVPISSVDLNDCKNTNRTENWNEQNMRAYLYWAPFDSFAVSAEYNFEQTKRIALSPEFQELETHRFPLTISYFNPQGYFASLVATYVNQHIINFKSISNGVVSDLTDSFWIVDFTLGYRLPNRFGIINFGIKNLFNEKLNYFNERGQTETPILSPYQPYRFIFTQFTLSF